MDIVALDPGQASQPDLTGYYHMTEAARAPDRPDAVQASYEATVERMKAGGTGLSPARYWIARKDDRIVAAGIVMLPDAGNAHHAVVEVRVHPDLRRQGIGTAVLRALLPEIRALGRARLTGQSVLAGGAGEQWAVKLGFTRMHGFVIQRLDVADADQASWQVPVPPGYRLQQWTGPVPGESLECYARARNAIHDAPQGDVTFQLSPHWTPERVREEEADFWRQDIVLWTVVAIDEASTEVAGLTEILFYPGFEEAAFQEETSVTAGHRGRGLGRSMKAAMLRRLAAERPQVRQVRTRTAGDNVHMQRVNREVGYETVREITDVEADLDAIEANLTA